MEGYGKQNVTYDGTTLMEFEDGETSFSRVGVSSNQENKPGEGPSAKQAKSREMKTHKQLVDDFIGSTTAHGLPRVFEKRNWFLTLFWTLVFFTAMGVSTWQGYRLIKQFLARDVNIRIEVVTASSLTFPSVTICNTNKLRMSAIKKSPHRQLAAVDTEIVRPYYASKCLDGDFRCNNTGCIKSYLKCDGYDNCRDRSDEVGCQYGDCNTDKFKCTTGSNMGVCIDVSNRCDRKLDCYGGEDEDQCECKAKTEFSCLKSGRCISPLRLCDGHADCPDRSDEVNCTESGMFCGNGYFECDGGRTCIPPYWKCDFYADCNDQTDEEDCSTSSPGGSPVYCSSDEFQCDAMNCVPASWECDDYEDCMSGTDEMYCNGGICDTGEFDCDDGDCYHNSMLCDGVAQCNDETDEDTGTCGDDSSGSGSGSGSGSFTCDDGETIPESYICDGYDDCEDLSDEDDAACAGRFACDNGTRYLSNDTICDSVYDCEDGSDEFNCANFTGNSSLTEKFTCVEDSTLIDITQRCNKVVDCVNASDELHCPSGRNASYTPDPYELLEQYSQYSHDPALYLEFVNSYYDDHMFGRVSSEDPPDWYGFIAYTKTPDYSDLERVLKLRKEEVGVLGHQIDDFILDCSFDGAKCDLKRDFRTYQDEVYGNCFQFNYEDPTNDTRRLETTKAGVSYGLKMTLNTEQDEYISVYGRRSGARVLVKTPGIPSIPSAEGITILPGVASSIGLREKRIKRQPMPYGDCMTESDFPSDFGHRYSKQACEETCVQTKMEQHCGCVDSMLVDRQQCMLLNRTQDVCKQLMHYLLNKDKLGCACKKSCEESWYEINISQSLWPSKTYLKHLLKQIHSKNDKMRKINDATSVSENLIRLEVFFEELNYESIGEIPAITEESLLSDIGGTLGLYCGFSFITMVEFLQFFTDLIVLTYFKYIHRRINPKK